MAFLTVPSMYRIPSCSPGSWLRHVRELCRGRRFDQVWIELVHSDFDEDFLHWLTTISPVRVAFLPESLEYDEEVYKIAPYLRGRKAHVWRQLEYMTHAAAVDEKDAAYLNAQGPTSAIWWPQAVPARSISVPSARAERNQAVFQGALYGERRRWLEHPALRNLLVRPERVPEDETGYPELFDDWNRNYCRSLKGKETVTVDFLAGYLGRLRSVRRACFELWLKSLQRWSFFSGYPGRVYEGMAAGRPVISWKIPDRPRTGSLFRDGEEIILFPRDRPDVLADHIRHIQSSTFFSRQITAAARHKISEFHTIEKRVRQIVCWIETGDEPDYGDENASSVRPQTEEAALHREIFFAGGGRTSGTGHIFGMSGLTRRLTCIKYALLERCLSLLQRLFRKRG